MRLSVVDRRSDGDVFTLVHRLPLSFRTQTFYLSLVVGAFVPRRLSELDGTITDEFSRHLLHRLGVAIDVQERDEPVPLILCLLYTSPSPRDLSTSRMPSSA